MYKKILLTVDGSENALRAADEALTLASIVGDAEVDLIYVIVPAKTARELLLIPTEEEIENLKDKKLEPIAQKFRDKNIKVNIVILNGEAANTIIKYEKENSFDLLVIGSRGLNAVQKLMQGSVSTKVMQKVTCPVLMVK